MAYPAKALIPLMSRIWYEKAVSMRLLSPIREDEMIAVFLQTEIRSARFQQQLLALLRQDEQDRGVVDTPDLASARENAYRMRLLGEFRGYRRNAGLFIGFPGRVEWYRAALTPDELMRVRYIDYSYWNELSGGTRLPTAAAQAIRAGKVVYGQSTQGFLQLADQVCRGAQLPELILTATSPSAPFVVMEGHVRLTACALALECLPATIELIVGFSPDFADWGAYGSP
jgi:hypothetical protein